VQVEVAQQADLGQVEDQLAVDEVGHLDRGLVEDPGPQTPRAAEYS